MNVIALGTAGLRGWRTKAADVLASRLAPAEEQIRAAIGALLPALTVHDVAGTLSDRSRR